MAAKESKVSRIHELITDKYLALLESGEELSPQILSQINKFLKDNDISSDPDENPKMKELQDKANEDNSYPFDVLGAPHPLEILK